MGGCPAAGGGEAQLEPWPLHGLRCWRELLSAKPEAPVPLCVQETWEHFSGNLCGGFAQCV